MALLHEAKCFVSGVFFIARKGGDWYGCSLIIYENSYTKESGGGTPEEGSQTEGMTQYSVKKAECQQAVAAGILRRRAGANQDDPG